MQRVWNFFSSPSSFVALAPLVILGLLLLCVWNFFSSNCEAIQVNLISSFIFALLSSVIVGLLLLAFPPRLARFFKLAKTNAIDLILPTVAEAGEVCVPSAEFEAASVIFQVFRVETQIDITESWGYYFLSMLMTKLRIVHRSEFRVNPYFSADFSFESEGNNPCIVCLGGPYFNIITQRLIGKENDASLCDPFFKFDRIGENNVIIDCETNTSIVQKDNEGKDYGTLQKLTLKEGKGTVIIAAGLGRNGTYTATDHLINNWKEIYDRYGDKDFGFAFMVPFITQKITGLNKEGMVREKPFLRKLRP